MRDEVDAPFAALLDRRVELERAAGLLTNVESGKGGVLVLEGPAGIGKTTLGEAVAELARGRGLAVLAARGAALERDLAYGIVRQLFDPALRALGPEDRDEMFAGAAALAAPALAYTGRGPEFPVTSEGMAAARSSAFHGLFWLTANLAERGPGLIWVDDAHWADSLSAQFLAYLARRIADLGLLLAVAARPGEPGSDPALRAIRDEPTTVLLPLSPLSPQNVAELLRDHLSADPSDAFVAACMERTRGNPYLLHELATDLRTRGVAPSANRLADLEAASCATLASSVLKRLERLPAGAIELAKALAVLELKSDLSLVARLADLDVAEAAEVADAMIAAEILDEGPRLAFHHPLVRDAVYTSIPTSRRGLLHGRAAALLRAGGAPIQRVAAQLLASHPNGDPEVVKRLREAAQQATTQGAPASAAIYLARALAEPPPVAERAQVLRDLGRAEVAAGIEAGFSHLGEAIALLSEPRERAAAALELGRELNTQVRFEDALELLEEAADAARPIDRELWIELETQLKMASRALGTRPDIERRFEELVGGLTGASAAERRALAVAAGGERIGRARSAAEAAELVERAIAPELGDEGGPPSVVSAATFTELPVLITAERLDRAEALLAQIIEFATRRGLSTPMVIGLAMRGYAALVRGALVDAEADLRAALEAAGEGHHARPPVIAHLVVVLVEQGRVEEAQKLLAEADYEGPLPEIMPANLLYYARARLRIAQRRWSDAVADLTELSGRYERWSIRWPVSAWRSHLALSLAALEREEEALRWAEEELEVAEEWGTGRALGAARRALGLLTSGEEAIELLRASVAALEPSPARLELARSLVALGSALRRQRQRTEAREILGRGMTLATECGARALSETAREELRATGARPRRLMLSGAESLTASERRVAQMAAEGMTNKGIAQQLFVSTRTVETHLSHAYQKLDIASRGELADALRGA
jgi:predicted ATPase